MSPRALDLCQLLGNFVIKTVLLAVDLTSATPSLLYHAVELTRQHDAKLIAVHAIEPLGNLGHALLEAYLNPEACHKLTTTGMDAMVQEVKNQVINTLTEEYLSGDMSGLNLGEVIVRTGYPSDVILHSADEVGADLIILGSHSCHNSSPSALGTVTQKVLAVAKVPVFLVPYANPAWGPNMDSPQLGLW